MTAWEEKVYERMEGREEGRMEGREEGISILIKDNMEENVPRERIIQKVVKNYGMSEEKARQLVDKYSTD